MLNFPVPDRSVRAIKRDEYIRVPGVGLVVLRNNVMSERWGVNHLIYEHIYSGTIGRYTVNSTARISHTTFRITGPSLTLCWRASNWWQHLWYDIKKAFWLQL